MRRWLARTRQHEKAADTHRRQREAPAERGAQPEAHDRRERVAEIAADAVRRVRVAEPSRRRRSR